MFSARYIYIKVTFIAVLASMIVWCILPKEYAATVKISDEYKETDLGIGLTHRIKALREQQPNYGNTGQNDIEIYAKILDSPSFMRKIADVQGVSIEHVKERILYNLHTKQATLDIQYTDKDSKVAQAILDTIVNRLQRRIWLYRHHLTESDFLDASKKAKKSEERLDSLRRAYYTLKESHKHLKEEKIINELNAIKTEIDKEKSTYVLLSNNKIREEALKIRETYAFAIVKSNTVHLEPYPNIWSIVLSVTSLSLIATWLFVNYKNKKIVSTAKEQNVFSPWNMTIGIWGIILILINIQQSQLEPLREHFWQCLIVWIIGFVSISYLSYRINFKGHSENEGIFVSKLVFNGLWILSMILSPLYLYTVMKVILQFDTTDMLYNIRMLTVYGDATSLLLNSTQGINIALFIAALWMYPNISKLKFISIIIAYLLVEFAMMEKSGILIMILSTLFVLYQTRAIKMRSIMVTLACTIAFFYFFNMSKETENQDTTSFVDFFAMYITTPPVAFGRLKENVFCQFGSNTFGQVYMYLNAFGFNFDYTERIQEFVQVPVLTNVYTIFQPFYTDFGVIGVFVFGLIYGALFGYIYALFKSGNSSCKLLYTYLVEVIIIQFYNENLMQNLYLSVTFTIWAILLTTKISGISFNIRLK